MKLFWFFVGLHPTSGEKSRVFFFQNITDLALEKNQNDQNNKRSSYLTKLSNT